MQSLKASNSRTKTCRTIEQEFEIGKYRVETTFARHLVFYDATTALPHRWCKHVAVRSIQRNNNGTA